MRGGRLRPGSTPALAGKPLPRGNVSCSITVHPRAGGEAVAQVLHVHADQGPPPRWRGSRAIRPRPRARTGSTPALAGKPCDPAASTRADRVHPRAGGEAVRGDGVTLGGSGPPPRWRGSRAVRSGDESAGGSTPALAGKPDARSTATWTRWVHPRAGGEAAPIRPRHVERRGPPPRWRGSRSATSDIGGLFGSTPALAGKPLAGGEISAGSGVHPRAGGEASRVGHCAVYPKGPPPRWRGSPQRCAPRAQDAGSTPALAGKPRKVSHHALFCRVHPRAGGEACVGGRHVSLLRGPPPRWRGSPVLRAARGRGCGSTPALAGKPSHETEATVILGVHPRAGGEAHDAAYSRA